MLDGTPISLTLTASQIGYMLSAVKFRRKKREWELSRSKFVPKDGHFDMNQVHILRLREVEDLLTETLRRHLERFGVEPTIHTCPRCGSMGAAFVCDEPGCPVNGGAAYGPAAQDISDD